MPRTNPVVSLSDVDRERLEAWVTAHGTAQQVALRCRIVLAAAAGRTNLTISEQFGINPKTVALWRDRFVETGPEGLWEIAPAAIAQFLDAWNENPNPFVWTATVESIQAKLARCRQTLEQIKPGCTAPRSGKKKIKSPVISRTPH